MTRALGTPQRGQTIPEVDRLAMVFSLQPLDSDTTHYDTPIGASGLYQLCISLSLKDFLTVSSEAPKHPPQS
jgi:hypothetical protein